MDKVLLDTNIILDYLSATRPKHRDAVDLLEGIWETRTLEPVISVSSLKDAYYILCRKYGDEALIRERLCAFAEVVEPLDLTREIAEAVFASDEPDFEDGLIRVTAERCHARAIVTRDASAFANSAVPHMDARAFCWEMDGIE